MAPNPTEAEVEPEAIEERDELVALIAYLNPKIKEMKELRRNAQRKLAAFPYRRRGPKEGRISHEHSVRQNLYATRYAYDMIQRWRYVQRSRGMVFAANNPKPPQSQNDAKDKHLRDMLSSLLDVCKASTNASAKYRHRRWLIRA